MILLLNFVCQSYAFLLLAKLRDNQNMQHTTELSVKSYQIMFLVFLHYFFYKNAISNWKFSKFSHKLFALWNELKFCLQHLLNMNINPDKQKLPSLKNENLLSYLMSIYRVGGRDQNGTLLLCCLYIPKHCSNQPIVVSNESWYLYVTIDFFKITLYFINFH